MRIQNNKSCLLFLCWSPGKVVVSEGTYWGVNRKDIEEIGPSPSWVWTFPSVQVLFSIFSFLIARDSAMASLPLLCPIFLFSGWSNLNYTVLSKTPYLATSGCLGIVVSLQVDEKLSPSNIEILAVCQISKVVEKTSLEADKQWYFWGQ